MENINRILQLLKREKSYNFFGSSPEMLKRRIGMRFLPTGNRNVVEYLDYLENHPEELENLMEIITIKVSHFFRNPLDFEILNKILGRAIYQKILAGESLRIWSAGCAMGEEPYSVALLVREQTDYNKLSFNIFATDIDSSALEQARAGRYKEESLQEVRLGLFRKWFREESNEYILDSEIREMVNFSFHDQLNPRSSVPSESIYGDFDIVLCRNVMIYYNQENKDYMSRCLYESLRRGGYLLLGEAENPGEEYADKLVQAAPASKIFKKVK